MIGNEVIQADLVAACKADAPLLAILNIAGSVKEDQYQGTTFLYPALRVAIQSQTPITNRGVTCDHARLNLTLMCYSEADSSKEADQIASAANARFHRRYFRGTGWYTWFYSSGVRSAIRLAEKLWRSEVPLVGTVYPTTPA